MALLSINPHLLFQASLSQLSCQNIKVTKSWNAVVTVGETTKLACKASSTIGKCVWINKVNY